MKNLIAILIIFFMQTFSSAQKNVAVTAKIVTENQEGILKIKAFGINTSDLFRELNYILVSVKKGKSGNSSNRQSGKFSLKPQETKTLSETGINVSKNDGLKVFLFIKDEQTGNVMSKDSLEINASQFKSEVSYIPEKNIELSGLTIDDTKTKLGEMFYEAFFKKYNQFPQKTEGTIIISEMPTFGRNTRILVSINDQLIHAFVSKPDEELIEAEADKALANLVSYQSKNSLLNKEFKY